jgi:hypothetical protein
MESGSVPSSYKGDRPLHAIRGQGVPLLYFWTDFAFDKSLSTLCGSKFRNFVEIFGLFARGFAFRAGISPLWQLGSSFSQTTLHEF